MSRDSTPELGRLARDYRRKRDLSQMELAEIMAIDNSAISHVEAGNRGIGITMLTRYYVAFGWEFVSAAIGVMIEELGLGEFDAFAGAETHDTVDRGLPFRKWEERRAMRLETRQEGIADVGAE